MAIGLKKILILIFSHIKYNPNLKLAIKKLCIIFLLPVLILDFKILQCMNGSIFNIEHCIKEKQVSSSYILQSTKVLYICIYIICLLYLHVESKINFLHNAMMMITLSLS